MSIPVIRAETFYLPPPARHPEDWSQIPPAQRVFRWAEHRQQRRLVPPAGVILGQQAFARINHNRWLADCLCGSAQVVTPADPRMACTECGLGWIVLVFPEDVAAVEASVASLLPHERNWWHDDDPAWDRPTEAKDQELVALVAETAAAAGLVIGTPRSSLSPAIEEATR